MDNNLTPEQNQKISDALASGRKIEAIKLYRQATGAGLKEAKEAIEALLPKLIEQDPTKFQKLAAGGGGCASLILLLLVLGEVVERLVDLI